MIHMDHILLEALSKTEVTDVLADARTRHTLIACWIAADLNRISWVAYLTPTGHIARLTFYPDLP